MNTTVTLWPGHLYNTAYLHLQQVWLQFIQNTAARMVFNLMKYALPHPSYFLSTSHWLQHTSNSSSWCFSTGHSIVQFLPIADPTDLQEFHAQQPLGTLQFLPTEAVHPEHASSYWSPVLEWATHNQKSRITHHSANSKPTCWLSDPACLDPVTFTGLSMNITCSFTELSAASVCLCLSVATCSAVFFTFVWGCHTNAPLTCWRWPLWWALFRPPRWCEDDSLESHCPEGGAGSPQEMCSPQSTCPTQRTLQCMNIPHWKTDTIMCKICTDSPTHDHRTHPIQSSAHS